MADENDDLVDDEQDDDPPPAEVPDEEDDDEKGEKPPAKKAPAKKAPRKPAAEGKVQVDARSYAKLIDERDRLRREGEERAEARKQRERQKTDEIAAKDWPKARQRLERQHAEELQERDRKIQRYESQLQRSAIESSIRQGLGQWQKANPNKPINPQLVNHLVKDLRDQFQAEWDDEAEEGQGGFVAVEPKTGLPAAERVLKVLESPDYEGFLMPMRRPGAGGAGGGMRPAASGVPGHQGARKAGGNPYADRYNAQQAYLQKGDPENGLRASVGLRRPTTVAVVGDN